jgi:periplasmic protein TonB
MTTTFAARASRQTVILTAIVGLHLGAFILVASGVGPEVLKFEPPDPPITFFPPKEIPTLVVAPDTATPAEVYALTVSEPDPSLIPRIDETPDLPRTNDNPRVSETGSGVVNPTVEYQPPTVRTRDRHLAAAIDACYPAASRRAGEEGRVVARIMIDAGGRATAWSVVQTSGFPRLDAALDCVIRRIEFLAGRRDGGAVAAEAMLPIVFRLH